MKYFVIGVLRLQACLLLLPILIIYALFWQIRIFGGLTEEPGDIVYNVLVRIYFDRV